MNKSLFGVKVAMLVANGFSQTDMVSSQKALIQAGANVRVVSPENGLVNGWDGQGWGHHFAVDTPLSSALAADFSVLVIPGGHRSIDKMNLTAHTKRFITGFMDSGKPVIVMDDALRIMILADRLRGHKVNGPRDMHDLVLQAGGFWEDQSPCFDKTLMTGTVHEENRDAFVKELVSHVIADITADQAA